MSSVFTQIRNSWNELTPSERKAAEYLNRNPSSVILGSIHDIARESGVSVASLSRLAVTLGYDGWKNMRSGILDTTPAIPENRVFSDITPADSDMEVAKKVFDQAVVSLQDTFRLIDQADLSRVVKAIKETDRIVFFGSGGSGCIARDESLRFAHMELAAEAYSEEFQMVLQASRMKKGQIAFGFSNSGRSAATVSVLEEARNNGAFTVGIANYRHTPLEGVSDVFFCTSFAAHGEMTAALTARIAIMCIMDALYVLSAHHGMVARSVDYIDERLESRVRLRHRNKNGNGKKPG